MEMASTWKKVSILMNALDANHYTSDYENLSDDDSSYQGNELSFFEKLKDKNSSTKKHKTSVETSLGLNKENEEISLKLPDNLEDVSVATFSQANTSDLNADDDSVLLKPDGMRQQESAYHSASLCDPANNLPIDPTSLPIAKVVLRRLPEFLLQHKSITMTEDSAVLYDSGDSPDFVIHVCRTCQRMSAARQKGYIRKSCLTCNTPLVFMCTKCHDNYYVDYDHMLGHWMNCKKKKPACDDGVKPMSSIRCFEKEKKNENSELQSPVKVFQYIECAEPRLPTVKVALEKLPESIVKLQRIIQNTDLIVATEPESKDAVVLKDAESDSAIEDEDVIFVGEIKSKDSSFNPEFVKFRCPKCRTIINDYTDIRQNHICNKCSTLLQYACTLCNEKYFINHLQLNQHRKLCGKSVDEWKDLSIVFYRCSACDFKTQREFSMVSHLETTRHTSDNSDTTTQTAEAYDKSTFVREQHAISISRNTKRYCPRRKKADHLSIRRHLWTKCNSSSRYRCVLCDYESIAWSAMQSHFARRHVSSEFHCDRCGFRAKRKSSLRRHIVKRHYSDLELVEESDADFDVSQPWQFVDDL